MSDLFDAASGTRVRHQEDRVHVAGITRITCVGVLLEFVHHLLGDLLTGVRPGVEYLVVAFAVGDHAALVELHDLHDVFFSGADDPSLAGGRDQVIRGEREAAPRAPTEADTVHIVEQIDRLAATEGLIAVRDHSSEFARSHRDVVEEHPFRKDGVEQHSSHGGLDHRAGRSERLDVGFQAATGAKFNADLGVRIDLAERMGQFDLFVVLENHPLSLAAGKEHREVVATHHHVLGRADDRRTVGRAEDVVGRQHQRVGLDLRLDGERQMHGHLVTVEVGVEALADQRMKLDRIPFNEHRLERLNAHAMQGGGTI